MQCIPAHREILPFYLIRGRISKWTEFGRVLIRHYPEFTVDLVSFREYWCQQHL